VVFCEVKTRTSDRFGSAAEAVTPQKVRKLRRLAGEWLSAARSSGELESLFEIRFDVAAVSARGGELSVEVIESAF
jgi:putative endonuclease